MKERFKIGDRFFTVALAFLGFLAFSQDAVCDDWSCTQASGVFQQSITVGDLNGGPDRHVTSTVTCSGGALQSVQHTGSGSNDFSWTYIYANGQKAFTCLPDGNGGYNVSSASYDPKSGVPLPASYCPTANDKNCDTCTIQAGSSCSAAASTNATACAAASQMAGSVPGSNIATTAAGGNGHATSTGNGNAGDGIGH